MLCVHCLNLWSMQLIIFGATGQVGKQLVKQALWRGHTVVAFGRNVYQLDCDNEKLICKRGSVFDAAEVAEAMQGSEAVLSALGGAFDGTDKTRSLGMKTIVAQMQKLSLCRIIAVGGLGILNADADTLLIDTPDYPAEYLPVGNEHRKAFEYLQASGLDWTFVCCPDIIDAPATGHWYVNKNYPPQPNHYRINAGDVAMFMLDELQRNEFIRARVGISN